MRRKNDACAYARAARIHWLNGRRCALHAAWSCVAPSALSLYRPTLLALLVRRVPLFLPNTERAF